VDLRHFLTFVQILPDLSNKTKYSFFYILYPKQNILQYIETGFIFFKKILRGFKILLDKRLCRVRLMVEERDVISWVI